MRNAIIIGALLALTAAAAAAQPAPHRAGLVIQYGDGSIETACVSFAEDQISGIELLERSDLPAVIQQTGIGAAVCKIGSQGCDYPAEGCFCARDGARAVYWAYQVLGAEGWRYSPIGAADVAVRDGDVNGWAWGAGDSDAGARPPVIGIDAICAPPPSPGAPPTAAAASAMPSPSPVATDVPAVSTAPVVTAQPSPGPAPAAQTGTGPTGYLAFAALAALLIAGAALAAHRRRR